MKESIGAPPGQVQSGAAQFTADSRQPTAGSGVLQRVEITGFRALAKIVCNGHSVKGIQMPPCVAYVPLAEDALLNPAATSGDETPNIAKTDSAQEETIWEVTELEEFLKWASATGQISESQHMTLSKLVKATGWSHRDA